MSGGALSEKEQCSKACKKYQAYSWEREVSEEEKRERTVVEALQKYDVAVHPLRETLPDVVRVYLM